MKQDNTTCQAVLGKERREERKKEVKSESNQVSGSEVSNQPPATWGCKALEMWPEMCQNKSDTNPGFQVLSKQKKVNDLNSNFYIDYM